MNKIKVLIIAAGIFIFSIFLYFVFKSQRLEKKIVNLEPAYKSINVQREEIEGKYNNLFKEYEAIASDRKNLLTQIKKLLADKTNANELQESLDRSIADKRVVEKEKQGLQNQNSGLKQEIENLRQTQASLTQERDDFKLAYEKARKNTVIKELNKQNSELQKKINTLRGDLKKAQVNIKRFISTQERLESEKKELQDRISEYGDKYAEALNKNRALEREIKNLPKKFSEIARQNERLIKDTSQMHYNLGVFYTRNKEYQRALAEFNRVIEITPDDHYAHFNLGYIYAECLVDRSKAIEHFRRYLKLAKLNDKDREWVKKYILTWETYEGKVPVK